MKVTVLVDNTALYDRMFVAEHGFSAYIEAGKTKILFDTGYSGVVLNNAAKMNIDLLDLDYIVLSHGHFDHTGGLWHLIQRYRDAEIEGLPHRTPTLIAHPHCFLPRSKKPGTDNGTLLTADAVQRIFPVEPATKPFRLAPGLHFLGEIERTCAFETFDPGSRRIVLPDGTIEPDIIRDDTSLAFRGQDGLVVISGCAHAGICNTIEYAKKVCNENRIQDIIGGLHLIKPGHQLDGTVAYLRSTQPAALHACHCTSLAAKLALAGAAPLQECGVGLRLLYDPAG
ncbi:MAG: MBL fold metallo-hydrolase [Methanomicrobiales archaeon]|nr:MBL fold metallo-hydrolase [Methanomicrobiales archaeon]